MLSKIKLTVLFSDPFWIGIFELIENEEYKVCKVTFGAEPKDEETYEFILKSFYSLHFSLSILLNESKFIEKKQNPKRIQRNIQKETSTKGIGTKAQRALKLQYEECKIKRKRKSKEQKELISQKKFDLRQKKKLKKHKGH